MSTFLELCQKVSRDSGTVQGNTTLSTVSGLSGRLEKIVFWTAEAWRQIQNSRSRWRWMVGELPTTAVTTAGTRAYSGASFGLTRFAEWIADDRANEVTIYKQATGVADEGPLVFVDDYANFRRLYMRGAQTNDRPTLCSINDANELVLHAIPDDTYVVQARYRKTPQELTADGDVPEMPARFHDLIAYEALRLLAQHDEGGTISVAPWVNEARMIRHALERDQLERITIGSDPLA